MPLLQLRQALGQHIGAQPRQRRAQVREAARPQQQLPQDVQGPALTDQIQPVRQPAGIVKTALSRAFRLNSYVF